MKQVFTGGGLTHRAKNDRRGVASLEFALVGAVLIILVFGLYDLGNAIRLRMDLQGALRVGAQYATSFPSASSSDIAAVVQAQLPASLASANVNATLCLCASGSCSITCGPSTTDVYMTLTVSTTYAPFLLSAITGNSASYVVRVQ